jgi:hypothetical protein
MFLWVSLPEEMDAEKLLSLAVEEGVAYVAGSPFFVDGSGANTLRLNFSKEDPERLREGVRRLARAIRAAAGRDRRLNFLRSTGQTWAGSISPTRRTWASAAGEQRWPRPSPRRVGP